MFQTARRPAPRRRMSVLAAAGMLALAGCGPDPAAVEQDSEGGSIPDPGGVEQLTAPDPTGDQRSHEAMREALSAEFPAATLTDTNDVLPNLRDLETELQRLSVDPQNCKAYVVSSAQPVPDGALIAAATVPSESESDSESGSESDSGSGSDSPGAGMTNARREATVLSFREAEAAEARIAGEQEGLENCPSYTASRSQDAGEGSGEGDDSSVSTTTEVDEESVRTAADQGIAAVREVSGGGETRRTVSVLLRQGAQIVAVSAAVEDDLSSDEIEETVETVQQEAADVLAELTGEDLSLPEPEDEDSEDEDSEDEDSAEGDGGGSSDE